MENNMVSGICFTNERELDAKLFEHFLYLNKTITVRNHFRISSKLDVVYGAKTHIRQFSLFCFFLHHFGEEIWTFNNA